MAMSFRSITLALLAVFLAFGNGAAQTTQTGVKVEIVSQEPLRLHVTLSVGGNKRVTIYRDQLPWATRYTMVWTVVTADGECLERLFPVEDGAVGRLSLDPGQVISGDVSLEGIFKGLDEARRKSDVHLFWAYKPPPELNFGRWSGGWILLPQSKPK